MNNRGDESKQYEGRKGGSGANAGPNKGDYLCKKSTEEVKRMVDGKMGHPRETGKGNMA